MKKYIIYIAILAFGLILGYMFFGNSSEGSKDHSEISENSEAESQLWTCSMHPQIMQPEPGDSPHLRDGFNSCGNRGGWPGSERDKNDGKRHGPGRHPNYNRRKCVGYG